MVNAVWMTIRREEAGLCGNVDHNMSSSNSVERSRTKNLSWCSDLIVILPFPSSLILPFINRSAQFTQFCEDKVTHMNLDYPEDTCVHDVVSDDAVAGCKHCCVIFFWMNVELKKTHPKHCLSMLDLVEV